MRLWIDTDVGDNPDDTVALLCARAHPDVELVGVSTTGGRSDWRAALARELVDAEVVPGDHPDEVAERFATARPEALLAIGPLTNIAALTVLDAAIPPLTVMGGVLVPLRHRSRLRRVEWNFSQDPGAAAVVVDSTDATIVPLDVTVAMRLETAVLEQLVSTAPRLLPEIERWTAEQDEPVVLHDPLALLVALGEPLVAIESRTLGVDANDGTLPRNGSRPSARGRRER